MVYLKENNYEFEHKCISSFYVTYECKNIMHQYKEVII